MDLETDREQMQYLAESSRKAAGAVSSILLVVKDGGDKWLTLTALSAEDDDDNVRIPALTGVLHLGEDIVHRQTNGEFELCVRLKETGEVQTIAKIFGDVRLP